MATDRPSLVPVLEPLRRARFERLLAEEFRRLGLRNERRAGRFVAFVGGLGLVVALVVSIRVDAKLGAVLALFGAGSALYYLAVVPRLLARRDRVGAIGWVNVSYEVTVPALVSLVDVHFLGGEYALTSSPPLLTFVAVVLAGLRLRRSLCVYAGALGAAEYGVVYAVARADIPASVLADHTALGIEYAVFHAMFLAGAGVLAAVVAHAGTVITRRMAVQAMEKERLGDLFGEYVSPKVLGRAMSGDLALSGERRQVTILVSDIREFTSTAFAQDPEEVVAYLNRYFGFACEAVGRHGGMVNKFVGDGLLAVFGAPEPIDNHATAAARAALDIVESTGDVIRPDGEPTSTRVAIHTGEVVLGTIGSPRRKDYTVIGDTVNLASRMEGLSKELGVPVLLSQAAVDEAGADVEASFRGEHAVRGRAEPVRVYELVSVAPPGEEAPADSGQR